MSQKILVVEDDPAIVQGLQEALITADFDVTTAMDGASGEALAIAEPYDLIILDVIMPKKNGFDVCRSLRERGLQTPVLMLTSKRSEEDMLLGFEVGVDDYLTKPFNIELLIARCKAVLRRASSQPLTGHIHEFGQCVIDFATMTFKRNGAEVKMSSKEFRILKHFIQREGQIVTREDLLDEVWGYDIYPTTRTVDNFILSIRKKIETDPAHPVHLKTVHTSGYRFSKTI